MPEAATVLDTMCVRGYHPVRERGTLPTTPCYHSARRARYNDACSDGARRKEACNINRSLSALGNVMGALVAGSQVFL